jgi:hypothetical protein
MCKCADVQMKGGQRLTIPSSVLRHPPSVHRQLKKIPLVKPEGKVKQVAMVFSEQGMPVSGRY